MDKIVFIIPDMTFGGAERLVSNIYTEWEQRYDVQLHLIVFNKKGEFLNQLPEKTTIHETGKNPIQIKRILEKENFDIIHSVLPSANFPVAFADFLGNFDAEIVYSIHSEKPHLPPWKKLVYRHLLKNRRIITPHKSTSRKLSREIRLPLKNFKDITNPVLRESDIQPKTGEKNRLIFTGRLTEIKRLDRMLKAIALLEHDVELFISGKGEKEEELKQLTEDLDIENKVHFLGFVDDITKEYQKSDIFVLSSDGECLNTSSIRALACGCNVVSTDVSGSNDIVTNSDIGRIVKKNPESLAQGIREVIEQEKDIGRLAEHSQKFLASEHSRKYYSFLSKMCRHNSE